MRWIPAKIHLYSFCKKSSTNYLIYSKTSHNKVVSTDMCGNRLPLTYPCLLYHYFTEHKITYCKNCSQSMLCPSWKLNAKLPGVIPNAANAELASKSLLFVVNFFIIGDVIFLNDWQLEINMGWIFLICNKTVGDWWSTVNLNQTSPFHLLL